MVSSRSQIMMAVGAACAAGLLAAAMMREPEPDTAAAVRPAAPPLHQAHGTPAVKTSAQPLDVSAEMRGRFENTSNYAAFIHDAMLRPAEGGRFYAVIAFNRCMEALSVEPATDVKLVGSAALHEEGLKIIRDLKARCSMVKDYFPNELALMRELKRANAIGVPDALLIPQGPLAPANPAFAQEDIARALRSGDPYLIAATLDMNIDSLADEIGSEFANGQNRPVLYMASAAASCEITGDCRDSFKIATPCVAGGICNHPDLRDHLRDSTDPGSRELFDKARMSILSLASRGQRSDSRQHQQPRR